jgi:gliding motility-associated lipoprotein GldH
MEEKRKMKRMINFIFLMVAAFVLASCFQRTVYDEYAHTPIAGWEKNDTLSFDIPPILTTGYYQENLGLRITGAYPFTGLTLGNRRKDNRNKGPRQNQNGGKEKNEKND